MREIEQVLKNWIEQAMSPLGTFPDTTDRAKWVADNFINWWRAAADKHFLDAQAAANTIRDVHEEMGISLRDETAEYLLDMTERLIDSLDRLREFLDIHPNKPPL